MFDPVGGHEGEADDMVHQISQQIREDRIQGLEISDIGWLKVTGKIGWGRARPSVFKRYSIGLPIIYWPWSLCLSDCFFFFFLASRHTIVRRERKERKVPLFSFFLSMNWSLSRRLKRRHQLLCDFGWLWRSVGRMVGERFGHAVDGSEIRWSPSAMYKTK